jgi:hypothetical protein
MDAADLCGGCASGVCIDSPGESQAVGACIGAQEFRRRAEIGDKLSANGFSFALKWAFGIDPQAEHQRAASDNQKLPQGIAGTRAGRRPRRGGTSLYTASATVWSRRCHRRQYRLDGPNLTKTRNPASRPELNRG